VPLELDRRLVLADEVLRPLWSEPSEVIDALAIGCALNEGPLGMLASSLTCVVDALYAGESESRLATFRLAGNLPLMAADERCKDLLDRLAGKRSPFWAGLRSALHELRDSAAA
jgi:hypothetical protein